jgi:DNA-binding NtrC family response regulator
MAATHRDLEKAIVDRSFREDLYYRLNVINVHLPPLRDRKDDIIPLAEFLMKKHAQKGVALPPITLELKHSLMSYNWPGNVRELENYVRKFLIFRDSEAIARELQAKATKTPFTTTTPVDARPQPAKSGEDSPILEQVVKAKQQAETDAILAALNSTRWNRKRAAALLKIDYKALLYKMKKLGIEGKPAASEVSSSVTHSAASASASIG